MGHVAGENCADLACHFTQQHAREFQIKAFMGEKGFEILPRKPLFSLGPGEDLWFANASLTGCANFF